MKNGGTSTGNPSTYTAVSANITLLPATRDGYTFLGWYDDAGNKIDVISTGSRGDVTLTARYSQNDTSVLPKFTQTHSYTISKSGNYWKLDGTDCLFEHAPYTESEANKLSIRKQLNQFKQLKAKYPDIKLYGYGVSSLSEAVGWYSAYNTYDYFQYIATEMKGVMTMTRLTFTDAADYANIYFHTDHHWNYLGSEIGYNDIYNMISKDFSLSSLKTPVATWDFTSLYGIKYKGSLVTSSQRDSFIAYEYNLGTYQTYYNNTTFAPAADRQTNDLYRLSVYKLGQMNKTDGFSYYRDLYGTDKDQTGVVILKFTDNTSAPNVLWLGDSTERALRLPLASHFGTTVFVDYRLWYKTDIDAYIEKYDIDIVLVSGLLDKTWMSDSWYLNKSQYSYTDY